jgi:hypothetical protein
MTSLRIVLFSACILLGVGCRLASFMPSSFTPPVSVTPTSTSNAPVAPSGWQTYENVLQGFAFRYPPQAIWVETDLVDVDSLAAFDLGTRVTSTTAISVPSTMLYVRVVPADDARIKNGYFSEAGWSDEGSRAETKELQLGGRTVYLAIEQDAAAGNRYASYTYAIRHENDDILLNFVVHSVNCANYADPMVECVEFDEARDVSGFDDIVGTVYFTERAAGTRIDASLFRQEEITESLRHAKIDVAYPRLEGFADAAAQTVFNQLVHDRVTARVDRFKEYLLDAEQDWDPSFRPWYLYGDYKVYPGAYGRFSVVFAGGEDTGGAHPNPYQETLVFDLANRKALSLEDVFTSGTDYVSFLSQKSLAELRRRNAAQTFTDERWLMEGAGPDEQNFQTFYLSDAGLVIVFTAYQVAPYAAGPSEVLIPYADMKGMLAL